MEWRGIVRWLLAGMAVLAAGARYVLKPGQPLTLKFRLWVHAGKASETKRADVWTAWVNSSEPFSPQTMNSNP